MLKMLAVTVVMSIGVAACKDTRNDAAASGGSTTSTELPTISLPAGVDGLRIKTPSADEVVLAKAGSVWKITAPSPGDADQANVQAVIDNLSSLKSTEVVSTKPEDDMLKTYNLDAAHVVHVVATAAGRPVLDMSFGKSGGRGEMARLGAGPVVALSGYSAYLYAGAERYRMSGAAATTTSPVAATLACKPAPDIEDICDNAGNGHGYECVGGTIGDVRKQGCVYLADNKFCCFRAPH